MNLRAEILLTALLVWPAVIAEAQETAGKEKEALVTKPVEPAGQGAGATSVGEPAQEDVFDLLRTLRNKPPPPPPGPDDYKQRMAAWAPVVTYNPTSGLGAGVAGNVAFYRGSPDTTRISSLVASMTATSKKQFLINAKVNGWALNNRWHIQGDNRLYWTSQKTYGLGTDTLERMRSTRAATISGSTKRCAAPRPQHYLGAGLLYSIHGEVGPPTKRRPARGQTLVSSTRRSTVRTRRRKRRLA